MAEKVEFIDTEKTKEQTKFLIPISIFIGLALIILVIYALGMTIDFIFGLGLTFWQEFSLGLVIAVIAGMVKK